MKKAIVLMLTVLMAFTAAFAGCGGGGGNNNETAISVPRVHEAKVEETDTVFTSGGNSDYRIVVPTQADKYDNEAAETIKRYVTESTGATIPIVNENTISYGADGKFIMIGETEAAEEKGYTPTVAELGTDGFKIYTDNNSLFLVSAPANIGKVWAAYEMLYRFIGWDAIAKDEIVMDNQSEVKFKKLTITEIPDIQDRMASNRQMYDSNEESRLFRLKRAYGDEGWILVNGRLYHNAFSYLPAATYNNESRKATYHPMWYSVPGVTDESGLQLCYTAHGVEEEYEAMLETSLAQLVRAVNDTPGKNKVMFAMEDNTSWCTCEKCSEALNKYGTNSAVVIMFLNDLRTMFDEYMEENGIERDIDIVFFAYLATNDAPAKDNGDGTYGLIDGLQCKDGVSVMFAPSTLDYTEPLLTANNRNFYSTMQKWSLVADNLYFWGYRTNWTDYLIPYGSINSMKENIRISHDLGVAYYFDESQHYASTPKPTGFEYLKDYLESKWMWNSDFDEKEMTDKFFEYYFKDASEAMRKYYDELRVHLTYMYNALNAPRGPFRSVTNKIYWPEGMLVTWKQYIDDAYDALAPLAEEDMVLYNKVRDRVKQESIAVRYMYLRFYGDKNDKADFAEMQEFKADMETWGWQEVGQGANIADLWSSWGLA